MERAQLTDLHGGPMNVVVPMHVYNALVEACKEAMVRINLILVEDDLHHREKYRQEAENIVSAAFELAGITD